MEVAEEVEVGGVEVEGVMVEHFMFGLWWGA